MEVIVKGKLIREIKQTKPFGSLEEEAFLNVLKTAALFDQATAEELKPSGLSPTQYNALRILRGAGPAGLPCQEIAERMITRDPDITRLLDRLEKRGLVGRNRSTTDRRVMLASITKEGLKLVASLDSMSPKIPKKVFGPAGEKRLRLLVELLEEARDRV